MQGGYARRQKADGRRAATVSLRPQRLRKPKKAIEKKKKAETSKLTSDGREGYRASRKRCNMRRPQQTLSWGPQVMEFLEHMFTFGSKLRKKKNK